MMEKINILIITKNQRCYNRKVRLSGYNLIFFKKKIMEDFDYIQEIRLG